MKIGMKLSDLLEDIIGQYVVVDCAASYYHGWKGKVVGFSGIDSKCNGYESGVNVTCDIINTKNQSIKRLGFAPSALRFM